MILNVKDIKRICRNPNFDIHFHNYEIKSEFMNVLYLRHQMYGSNKCELSFIFREVSKPSIGANIWNGPRNHKIQGLRQLSKPQPNHNSTWHNQSWVWHENDFTPPPTTTTQTQCWQYFNCYSSDFDKIRRVFFHGPLKQ